MHPRKAAKLASVVMLVALTCADVATAGEQEDETYAAFEWFCLAHLGAPTEIPRLFDQIGIEPLGEEYASPFLYPQEGTAWFLPGSTANIVVTLSVDNVCTVTNPNVSGDGVLELLRQHTSNLLVREETVGTERQLMFAVSIIDGLGRLEARGVVLARVSNLTAIDGISLSAAPEALLRANGIEVPRWPSP